MTMSLQPEKMVQMIGRALVGRPDAVTLATCTFLAGGHLLIEDVPGVGKTTLARAMARTFGGEFKRIQFTADMLPSDIIGVSVWDPGENVFRYRKGPLFANLVLSDEINRAPPRTQSALLEAMSEKQISVDGTTYPLPFPFMVVATQNAKEHYGTYPLPESQMDRFMMRISLGYTPTAVERQFIARPRQSDPLEAVEPVFSPDQIAELFRLVDQVRVDDSVLDYLMTLVERTRLSSDARIGVGPRGTIALHRAAQALALLNNRNFVLVDDIKKLAPPVLGHRIVPTGALTAERSASAGSAIISAILFGMEIPL